MIGEELAQCTTAVKVSLHWVAQLLRTVKPSKQHSETATHPSPPHALMYRPRYTASNLLAEETDSAHCHVHCAFSVAPLNMRV